MAVILVLLVDEAAPGGPSVSGLILKDVLPRTFTPRIEKGRFGESMRLKGVVSAFALLFHSSSSNSSSSDSS